MGFFCQSLSWRGEKKREKYTPSFNNFAIKYCRDDYKKVKTFPKDCTILYSPSKVPVTLLHVLTNGWYCPSGWWSPTLYPKNFTPVYLSKRNESKFHKNTYANVFIAALFIITKNWKWPKYPSIGWLKRLWYVHTEQYCSANTRRTDLPNKGT